VRGCARTRTGRVDVTYVNPLLERLASGGTVYVGWSFSSDPLIAETIAAAGFDAVLVDQQHGSATLATLPALCMVIEARGAVPVTRVPSASAADIGRSLDLGAMGVMVPMIDTAEQAAAAVAACRYQPGGLRSYGPHRIPFVIGPGGPRDLEQVLVMIQIETAAALENVEEIASVPGVGALFLGPYDLSLSMGLDADIQARTDADGLVFDAAVRRIVGAANRAGIAAGIYSDNGRDALRARAMGFRIVCSCTDVVTLNRVAAAELKVARSDAP
jgi:4-hydroxy-2-oxoheptanedioate aldolase